MAATPEDHTPDDQTPEDQASEGQPPEGQLTCPHCGRRFNWKARLAGRAVKCKCGGGFRVPTQAGGEARPLGPASRTPGEAPDTREVGATGDAEHDEIKDDQTYALNTPDDDDQPQTQARKPTRSEQGSGSGAPSAGARPAANSGKCPNCNQSIKPGAVLCVKCGFNLQEGRKLQTEVAADDAAATATPAPATADADAPANASAPAGTGVAAAAGDPADPRSALGHMAGASASATAASEAARRQHVIDLYVPGALILFGMATNVLYSHYLAGDIAGGLIGAMVNTILQVVFWVPLAFVGMLLAVKLLDVSFGTLGVAIYKLIGIALGPSAAWSICIYLMPPLIGGFVGFFAMLIIYFTLLTVLFDLEGWDAIILMIIIFVIDMIMRMVGLGMILYVIHAIF